VARVAVIGEGPAVAGYALAGALVLPAEDEAAVRACWDRLPPDVVVVVLTAAAARALGPGCSTTRPPYPVVMPG
jgi:vacuolar-type H+-ATPase subunit F/Vma7